MLYCKYEKNIFVIIIVALIIGTGLFLTKFWSTNSTNQEKLNIISVTASESYIYVRTAEDIDTEDYTFKVVDDEREVEIHSVRESTSGFEDFIIIFKDNTQHYDDWKLEVYNSEGLVTREKIQFIPDLGEPVIVESVTIASSNEIPTVATVGDVITLKIRVSEPITLVSHTYENIDRNEVEKVIRGNEYTSNYTVSDQMPNGRVKFKLYNISNYHGDNAVDWLGNDFKYITETSDGSYVDIIQSNRKIRDMLDLSEESAGNISDSIDTQLINIAEDLHNNYRIGMDETDASLDSWKGFKEACKNDYVKEKIIEADKINGIGIVQCTGGLSAFAVLIQLSDESEYYACVDSGGSFVKTTNHELIPLNNSSESFYCPETEDF